MTAAVKVLAFAGARDVLGAAEMLVELDEGSCSASALMDKLCHGCPELAAYRPIIRFAINGEYVEADAMLRAGDEVALIPPVAGG